jgi:hypothetical protein
MQRTTLLTPLILCAALLGAAGLSACAGPNAFEMACRDAGHAPGSAAYERCLQEAYAKNERLSQRYRSGGP